MCEGVELKLAEYASFCINPPGDLRGGKGKAKLIVISIPDTRFE
jgi:hypothetical protein